MFYKNASNHYHSLILFWDRLLQSFGLCRLSHYTRAAYYIEELLDRDNVRSVEKAYSALADTINLSNAMLEKVAKNGYICIDGKYYRLVSESESALKHEQKNKSGDPRQKSSSQ